MAKYKCEETSSCEKFQCAVCLHCNRLLCVQHIIEHDKFVLSSVDNLSNMVEDILKQIKYKSEKSRTTCDDVLPGLDEWRREELEKIEQIYKHESQLIGVREETLKNSHRYLLEEVEQNARQPLERVQREQNTNVEILNHIQQTIDNVRKESEELKWDSSASPTVNSEYSPSDFVQMIVPMGMTTSSMRIENQSAANKKPSSIRSSQPSINNVVKLRSGHALKRLVQMFSNILSVQQSKVELETYIRVSK
jgi:hypothetical protein